MRHCGSRLRTIVLLCLALVTLATRLSGQDWAKPLLTNLHRLDMRDLGYPQVNEIPVNSSAVSALLTAKSGNIYGATSGEESYLFVYEPALNKVRHLGRIKGEEGVHHSLVQDGGGYIYIGTGKNMFGEMELSRGNTGQEQVDRILWNDIVKLYEDYPGGHLYRYDPAASDAAVRLPGMDCDVIDCGIPVPRNSIYALAANPVREEIYGITYPDGRFFVYDIRRGEFSDIGAIDDRIVFHGPERHWRSLPRDLICDGNGNVYTSGASGEIVCYDPVKRSLQKTGMRIPGDYYYAEFYEDYAVVDCFAMTGDGTIFGGTCDGYLFSFSPDSLRLVNHGKAQSARRMRGITAGADGKIYFISGERGGSKHCTFFSFDPECGGFTNHGMLIVDRSPYYYWRGYQFDAMTTGRDGAIYLGESERRSHLFLFMPWN